MDRLEAMIYDHGKELASLKDKVVDVEKTSDGSIDIWALKADIDELKKEVISLRSTNLITLFEGLEIHHSRWMCQQS